MKRLTPLVLLTTALAAGCGYSAPDPVLGCRSDSECDNDEVCFVDGCGDPGKNIVVEVVPNPRVGLHAQDFRVTELRSQQNIELYGPALLKGQVRVEGLSSTSAYSAPITLRMTGESLLIPGLVRRHESTLVPTNGLYSLPVGAGRYDVTLSTNDAALPPLSSTRDVQPGDAVTLDFTLPVSSELVRLSGKVVRPDGKPVDVDLEVQAQDEQLRPLSQRVMVTRESGAFTLSLPPTAAERPTVVLQVVPTSPQALVPQKQFTVNPRQGALELSMGDYGEPVRLRARVLDRNGQPVAQATVSLQGKVSGGGQFRSQKVLTDETGAFELLTLPNETGSSMTLSVVPPPGSSASFTLRYVQVPRVSVLASADVVCGERVLVRGELMKPSGSQPAAGVAIMAEPLEEVPGWSRSTASFQAPRTTDEAGRFELPMDPGRYRLDFIPTEDLPRVSRIVTVPPPVSASVPPSLELSTFTLSKGRSVNGQVTFTGSNATPSTAPYASIRFFRVVDVEGKSSALLLSQTLTDQTGAYSTTVPAR
ncbi:MAG TPA: carboxypeptidase regulatory-like domain-containing protein [Archangium sp.]|uniref:carboxypeptidase regulatory-like domain-containing protein n=1 Tax=Archangium sp. TaxID=1872627 RepID=UPI002E2F167E|nr:carboxypeptidase regulatory-like domain-containing protein [Archangium sp.]HEX5748888.1 carboxypeptidase regulatory-like domain-containing protein [Archangium sp.]